jgi:hypothetical protein
MYEQDCGYSGDEIIAIAEGPGGFCLEAETVSVEDVDYWHRQTVEANREYLPIEPEGEASAPGRPAVVKEPVQSRARAYVAMPAPRDPVPRWPDRGPAAREATADRHDPRDQNPSLPRCPHGVLKAMKCRICDRDELDGD